MKTAEEILGEISEHRLKRYKENKFPFNRFKINESAVVKAHIYLTTKLIMNIIKKIN